MAVAQRQCSTSFPEPPLPPSTMSEFASLNELPFELLCDILEQLMFSSTAGEPAPSDHGSSGSERFVTAPGSPSSCDDPVVWPSPEDDVSSLHLTPSDSSSLQQLHESVIPRDGQFNVDDPPSHWPFWKGDVASCSQVSRVWREAAKPHLFDHVRVTFWSHLRAVADDAFVAGSSHGAFRLHK